MAVSDDSIEGEQTVHFTPAGTGRVSVELALDYRIRRRNPTTPLVDRLFVRPAMRRSLENTLRMFATELAARRHP